MMSTTMMWTHRPESVLVLRKHLDHTVAGPFCKMTTFLVKEMELKVYVETRDLADPDLDGNSDFKAIKKFLLPFVTCEEQDAADLVDFVICLGGDATLLDASLMFQGHVPPVMAFNVGSRGFLTPFQFGPDFRQSVTDVIEGYPCIFDRFRLDCVLNDGDVPSTKTVPKDGDLHSSRYLVLNEVVINRGPSCTLSNYEIYIGNRLVTSVLGDGLIMSTPTGSTAYSVSAGASMVHPNVPSVLITPICPHSLSFRPVIVPAGVQIKVKLCGESLDSTCMVCFDGRERQEMKHGQVLQVTTANRPLPSICSTNQTEDWFDSLAKCLNWNIRLGQKPMETSGYYRSSITEKSKTHTKPQKLQSKTLFTTSIVDPPNMSEEFNELTGSNGVKRVKVESNKNNVTPLGAIDSNNNATNSVSQERPGDLMSDDLECKISAECSTTADMTLKTMSNSFDDKTSTCSPDTHSQSWHQTNKTSSRNDIERYYNALNDLNTTNTEAKSVKCKDNTNETIFHSSDSDKYRKPFDGADTIFNNAKESDASVIDRTVNSIQKLNSDISTETMELCDKNLPNLSPQDYNKSIKAKSIIYKNAVNSLTVDMPRKDRENYMNSLNSFIIENETKLKTTTVLT